MTTPIYSFVKEYAGSNIIRAHMPGHKGDTSYDDISKLNPFDITEIHGADSLFDASSIIAESEENATRLFNTAKTIYSTAGSTLCIQTMLALATEQNKNVIAARNCHRAFLSASILLDINVKWLYSNDDTDSILSVAITESDVEKAILDSINEGEKASCVYITSPSYLGNTHDIKAIADICHRYDVLLLVDNAHGSYLAFCDDESYPHPIKAGADICCDSAHKTLPVLTGGAYLHFSDRAKAFTSKAKESMALFGSTSPSYLIMQSLDLCNVYLEKQVKSDLDSIIKAIAICKSTLADKWYIEQTEPCKITINARKSNVDGIELANKLRFEHKIECEYADNTHIVLMFSSKTSQDDIKAVAYALCSLADTVAKTSDIKTLSINIKPLEKAMSIRKAGLCSYESVATSEAIGKACAKAISCCPPGVAVVVPGEVFSKECIEVLENYGITKVNVVC